MEENTQRLANNLRARFAVLACGQWLGVRLQLLGVLVVTLVAFVAVVQHHFQHVDAGLVGLGLTYALAVTGLLNGLLGSFTETEKELVAIERISEYAKNAPPENYDGILTPASYWPLKGSLEFELVNLRYDYDQPLALRDLSFTVYPEEKIGIVGRTGSGKSSIFQALFRATELHSGRITLDGVDIRDVGLERLRSSLAIVPQAPFLFSGTVRDNLDIDDRWSDADVQKAVDACGLDGTIASLGGLHAEITERGSNMSVGERQLFCLARALLSRTKIICIDEATAHVDPVLDKRIQAVLTTAFASTTVLTIAHRIATVMTCDRVLVMEGGCLVEEGAPHELMERGGVFARMARI